VVKSRRMRWAGHVARMGEDRGVHRVLVGKPEGKCVLYPPHPAVTNIAICRQTSVKSPIFFADVNAVGAELLYADRRTDGRT
jgi:hypothetical protein